MTRTKADSIAMRLICQTQPPDAHAGRPTEFGLQDKKQVLHPGVRLPDGALRFDFIVTVERKPNQTAPKFGGPFVHGTTDTPFVYLGYREAQDGAPWIRRLKIHLSSITWAQVEAVEAAQVGEAMLEARVSGQGSATVPLLGEGWQVRTTGVE